MLRASDAELVSELKHCVRANDLNRGKILHLNAEANGRVKSRCVASALISMYSKCGSMEDAHKVFDNMNHRDAVSWTVLMLGYVNNGHSLAALNLFDRMDCSPDGVVFVAALKACARLAGENIERNKYLQRGIAIHKQAREHGLDGDVPVANTLIDMYSKCGDMSRARYVFDGMKRPGVVALSALVIGYMENGDSRTALNVFRSMQCAPDRVLVVAGLKACAALAKDDSGVNKKSCLLYGKSIHKLASDHGLDREKSVANTLVDMYSKCGSMPDAVNVFKGMIHRDVVSWNNLILGFVENGDWSVALDVFDSMDSPVNSVSFVAAFKACGALASSGKLAKTACLTRGLSLHKQAREKGFEQDMVLASTLVDFYGKCGEMSMAKDTFDRMKNQDVVSWNALVLGYVDNGESPKALEVFNAMDCAPDRVTCIAALKACAVIGALDRGESIHARVCELKLEHDEAVASCLVDFYGKCGNMDAAEDVFNGMRSKNMVSWNALIGGYTLLGDASQVFSLVKRMQESGQQVDSVTMLLILSACSHAGMVVEGQRYFESMSKLNVTPTIAHYTCMADMLCRVNKLEEALSLIREMPFKADSHIWLTLLGACRNWKNEVVGQVAFHELVLRNDKEHLAAAYVLMQSIYESLTI